MESDSGEYFVAISKAQGCDEIKILDPNFIGWVRRYGGPFYGETWEQIDTDVDKFLCDISGEESDEEEVNCRDDTEFDDETFKTT